MLTAAALALLVNVATGIFNWMFAKVGRVGTQIFIFVIALFAALYWQYGQAYSEIVQTAIILFCMAVGFYEAILQYFPIFKGPQG